MFYVLVNFKNSLQEPQLYDTFFSFSNEYYLRIIIIAGIN